MKIAYKKKLTGIITTIFLIIVVFLLDRFGVINIDEYIAENDTYIKTSNTDNLYEVIKVVDGDTIVIKYGNNEEKVRLIGIDTPESVHPDKTKNTNYGKIASSYTKSKLYGKYVALELDVQERDKYGRILAYVYLDGEMFNKTLLKEGYAKVATYPPNVKYVDEFVKIEKNAKKNKVGLWGYEED